ncbi:MAG TPA: hypothetical protein VFJ77_00535 [Gaiellaceae bacterium]|nr:hypothetical protein [Gaiellaceae bacterium]
MDRARRHQRLCAGLTLGLLTLVAELGGRSLTHRLDVGRRVGPVSYQHESYYPFLLAGVKVAAALVLARLAWRFAKATAAARDAHRLGGVSARRARVPIQLSRRLWLASFLGTATLYLVQTDAERLAAGRWPLLAPWLHTSALPVFAVLAVVVAVVFRAVEGWLADVEASAADAVARARRLAERGELRLARPRPHAGGLGPRLRFGLAFESRPPPGRR